MGPETLRMFDERDERVLPQVVALQALTGSRGRRGCMLSVCT